MWGAAAGSFLVRAGFGLILPALPVYLRIHAIAVPDLGLASGAYLAFSIVGMLLLSPLTDRVGPVRGLLAGGVVYAAGTLLLLVFPSAGALLLGRGLQGLSMALYAPATFAYIGQSVPAPRRGRAYGAVASAQMAGFILGPTVGGLALGLYGPAGCLLLAGVAAVATLLVSLLLPAAPPIPSTDAGPQRASGLALFVRPLTLLLAAPWGVGFLAYTVGQQVPNGVYQAVWSLFMYHLGAAPWLVGASYATWALPLVVLSPLFGRYATARHVRLGMIVGGAVMAAAAVTYSLLQNPYAVAGVGLLEGIGAAAVLPLGQIYLAERVPLDRMAGTQAVATGLGQVVALVAAVASGFIFPLRAWLPFLLAATGLAVGTWLFARRHEPAHTARESDWVR